MDIFCSIHQDTDGKWPDAFNIRIFKLKELKNGQTYEVKLHVQKVEKQDIIKDMKREKGKHNNTYVLVYKIENRLTTLANHSIYVKTLEEFGRRVKKYYAHCINSDPFNPETKILLGKFLNIIFYTFMLDYYLYPSGKEGNKYYKIWCKVEKVYFEPVIVDFRVRAHSDYDAEDIDELSFKKVKVF